MPDFKRRAVFASSDAIPTIGDVMQLIARLPYFTALELAGLFGADVEKVCQSATDYLAETEAADGKE